MKISRKIHHQIRLQNLIFSLLFITVMGLLAWLSTRYSIQFDWTAASRHTLSEASRKVLGALQGPIKITAYARENKALREQINDQINRYRRVKPDISLEFVNPDTKPDKVRELGITADGELVIEYQGRSENLQEPGESTLTNALQRLASARGQPVVFLEGHGERSPTGQANQDLGQFGGEIKRKGANLLAINLGVTPKIPDNASVLVLASPQAGYLPGEVANVEEYVKKGGNLLWLGEPGDLHGLQPLADQLGLGFLPGTVVDANTQLFGIDDPTFALVAEYSAHPITHGFQTMTLFPTAAALEKAGESGFEATPLLSTLARSWTETGAIEGKIEFNGDKGERQGPLTIGFVLTRERPAEKPPEAKKENDNPGAEADAAPQQRIVVIGDGDFLSNSYLGNAGNLNLGLNIVQWLSQNDQFINIPAKTAPDQTLNLSPLASGSIAVGFLVVLPLVLLGTGFFIWLQRRKR
jgi:ABC-type uncharacterized transport system involved in gliding motility auxiliary subunit